MAIWGSTRNLQRVLHIGVDWNLYALSGREWEYLRLPASSVSSRERVYQKLKNECQCWCRKCFLRRQVQIQKECTGRPCGFSGKFLRIYHVHSFKWVHFILTIYFTRTDGHRSSNGSQRHIKDYIYGKVFRLDIRRNRAYINRLRQAEIGGRVYIYIRKVTPGDPIKKIMTEGTNTDL